jgi:replicative DNA helicase
MDATTGMQARLPPHNLEAEQSVLGSVIRDNHVLNDVMNIIEHDEHFYTDAHRKIYRAIKNLFEHHKPIDLVTLGDQLHQNQHVEDIGGYGYLAQIYDATPAAANGVYYARIVRDKSILRSLLHAGTEILRDAQNPSGPAQQVMEEAERKIFQIAERGIIGQYYTMEEALQGVYDRIDARHLRDPSAVSGLPTGYVDLDNITAGLQESEMIIVAARPSVGKTALALNLVRNMAVDEVLPIFFVSLEQTRVELAERLLSCQAMFDGQRLRRGHLGSEDMQRIINAGGILRDAKIFIDDSPGQSMLRIMANARRLKHRHGIRAVFVDYLQLVEPDDRRESRQEQVAVISRRLKFMAKDLKLPVVACAQLNRAVEHRAEGEPKLADLRESGCITGDALITLADTNERVPFSELLGRRDFKVWALNEETLRLEAASVANVFCTGRKPVYDLETQLGRRIRATGNHQFRAFLGWKRLDQLVVGDRIALPRCLPETSQPSSMSAAELALLGHLIGDGCTLPRHVLQYTTRERDLAERVASLATDLFADAVKPRIKAERQWYQVYLTSVKRLTHGVRNPVAVWLDRLGAFGKRSYEKNVPDEVFRQPNDLIGVFLRHLWATDGCIRPPAKSHRHPSVYYATSSPKLALDVQSLLLSLGINAVLRPRSQGSKGRMQYHVLVMGKEDLLRFAELVGSVGQYKTTALQECVAWLTTRKANTNRDVIPSEVWRRLAVPAMQRNKISLRAMQSALGMACMGTTLYQQNVSRERMTRLAPVVGDDETLKKLAASDVYWDAIRSITPIGEEEVFDLTVPGHANFIVNNIIAHNSIEQDADTVMLLHRPKDKNTGQDIDGVLKIIVAKQRNGPTGSLLLTHMKHFMRFENYAGPPLD